MAIQYKMCIDCRLACVLSLLRAAIVAESQESHHVLLSHAERETEALLVELLSATNEALKARDD